MSLSPDHLSSISCQKEVIDSLKPGYSVLDMFNAIHTVCPMLEDEQNQSYPIYMYDVIIIPRFSNTYSITMYHLRSPVTNTTSSVILRLMPIEDGKWKVRTLNNTYICTLSTL